MKLKSILVRLLKDELLAAIRSVKDHIEWHEYGIGNYNTWTRRAKAANPFYVKETKKQIAIYKYRLLYLKNKLKQL